MTSHSASAIIPHLCCRNASEAIEFYQKALGAEKVAVFKTPNGHIAHAELKIEGAAFYVVDEWPEQGGLSPLAHKGTPVSLYLRVADSDALYRRAIGAGCKVRMPLQDMFWGDRYGLVEDPYGHNWEIATAVRTVSHQELQRAVSWMQPCTDSRVAG